MSLLLPLLCLATMAKTGPIIAILPLINQSGEKWQELKDRQTAAGENWLRKEMARHGFVVLSQESVAASMKTVGVDLTDEENQKREPLYEIGRETKADYVFFAVITDTNQKLIQQFLSSKREGTAKIKIWLLDVTSEKPILSAKLSEGKSGGGFFAGLDKGSDRQVQAVINSLNDALKDFLKDYPALDSTKGGQGLISSGL
jgi:hypothetical protein